MILTLHLEAGQPCRPPGDSKVGGKEKSRYHDRYRLLLLNCRGD